MTLPAEEHLWRRCNLCKAAIRFEAEYYRCSVSTCNRKRTGLIFCSLPCFEAHLPEARHRDAWAERQIAPTRAAAEAELASEAGDEEAPKAGDTPRGMTGAGTGPVPQRRIAVPASPPVPAAASEDNRAEPEAEVLVVVSKLKKYVRDWSGMNTSDSVIAVLSEHLRELSKEAIRQAGLDGRRTVLDRDFTKVLTELTGGSREGNFRSRR
jgi:hypothetical protein